MEFPDKCECGSTQNTNSVSGYSRGNKWLRRTRICKDCGKRWSTVELRREHVGGARNPTICELENISKALKRLMLQVDRMKDRVK